jgi:hypothetical protein
MIFFDQVYLPSSMQTNVNFANRLADYDQNLITLDNSSRAFRKHKKSLLKTILYELITCYHKRSQLSIRYQVCKSNFFSDYISKITLKILNSTI